jgi:hypothetical protein
MKLAALKHTVKVPFFEEHGLCTVSEILVDPFTGPVLRLNLTFVQKLFPIGSTLVLVATYI